MTDLMSRPILRVKATAVPPRRPMAALAAAAGVSSAAVGLLVCVAVSVGVWFSGDTASFGGAVRVGAFGWLVSNGAGIVVDDVPITAIPLGFMAACGLLVYRAGRWAGTHAAVRRGADLVVGIVTLAAAYDAAGVVVWSLTTSDSAHADLARTVIALGLLGLGFGGVGVISASGSSTTVLGLMPAGVRASTAGALAGVSTMLAAGALLLAASLLTHFSQAVVLSEGLAAGTVGGMMIAVTGIALVPNAVLCAGSFIAGPGFAVGSSTGVALGDVHLGALPAVPILAALPTSGAASWWVTVLIVVPVLAGGVAGLVAIRHDPVFGLDQAALRGALSGALGGVSFGVLTWLATGAVGPGRMQDIGPDVLGTTLVCGLAFLLGGAVAATCARWWQPPLGAAASQDAGADVPEGSDEQVTQPVPRMPHSD